MLCNVFINDLSNGLQQTFAEFADDGRLYRALEALENRAFAQNDLGKPE